MVTQIIELSRKYILNFKHYKYHGKGRRTDPLTGATNNTTTLYNCQRWTVATKFKAECRINYVIQTC